MATMNYEQIVRAAEALTPDEQAALIAHLQAKSEGQPRSGIVTRERILEEFKRRKAVGAFKHVKSLRGMFAHPSLDLSFEEIQGMLHEAGTEWENEMDEFNGTH